MKMWKIIICAMALAACSGEKKPLPECSVYEKFDNLATLLATDSTNADYRVVTLYFRISNNTAADCFVPVRTTNDADSIYASHFEIRVGNRAITPDIIGKGEPQATIRANCSKAYKMRILAPGLRQLGIEPMLPLDSIAHLISLNYIPVRSDQRFSKLPLRGIMK